MFLMVALFSCGTGEAQKSVSLGPQEFEKQLATEGERILLDVRTPGEFGERRPPRGRRSNSNRHGLHQGL